jgi:hypothetical protein
LEKQERKPKGQSRQLGETGEKAEGAIKNRQLGETGEKAEVAIKTTWRNRRESRRGNKE